MPKNDNIVNLLINVTLMDTSSPQPLTPLFNILADSQQTIPGSQRFSCSGRGDNDQDLLKDILRKIIDSYPTRPISLCLSGSNIVPDAQCPAPAATAAPKEATTRKASHKATTPKKPRAKTGSRQKAQKKSG